MRNGRLFLAWAKTPSCSQKKENIEEEDSCEEEDTFEKWSPVLGMGEDAKLLPEEGKYNREHHLGDHQRPHIDLEIHHAVARVAACIPRKVYIYICVLISH